MQRLYSPEQGRLLVDGIDISLIDAAQLRRQIGVVLQENLLFNRSVRENIAITTTVRQAHRIVVLDKGRLVEEGSHDALLRRPQGLYAHLWSMQAGSAGKQVAVPGAVTPEPPQGAPT